MTEAATTYKQIRFVPFKDLVLWDVKRMMRKSIASDFPIVKLGTVITEQNNREKIFEKPNDDFKILGVNNKVGLFDAYIEKGKNINQPYKKVEEGWLAFNPYRINVGSIGIKLPQHKYDYISPAYVVFSCKKELHPEFLFLLFKTDTFNTIIRENTTGSVRQNLLFETLSTLQIPLPPFSKQKELVDAYHKQIKLAERYDEDVEAIEKGKEPFFYSELGITNTKAQVENTKGKIHVLRFKNIEKWALTHLLKEKNISFENAKYESIPIKKLLIGFDGGKTPTTSKSEYWNGNINWVSPKDFNGLEITSSEDTITDYAIEHAGMKVFKAGVILGVFRSGILRHSFPVAMTKIPVAINQDLKAIEVNTKLIDKYFLLHYLSIMQKYVLEKCSKVGVTVESINSEDFLNIPVIVPPKPIQIEIVKKVEEMNARINSTRTKTEQIKTLATKTFEKTIFSF